MQILIRLVFMIFGLLLAGCSSSVLEQLPQEIGGLPADAPARPEIPFQYPAVHDMPPPRAAQTMSDEELLAAEKALKAARERQEKLEKATDDDDAPTPPKSAKKRSRQPVKKKPTEDTDTGAQDHS